jgi:flagellar biosynthetic protein FliR
VPAFGPPFNEAMLHQWLAALVLPFIRVASIFMIAPVLSIRQIPVRLRVFIAVMITWAIQPLLPDMPLVTVLSGETFLMILQQIGIGVAIGFLLQLAFNALIFGGQVMAYSMGLGFAHMMDPTNGVQVPVVSQYWLIMAMLAFLLSNSHLILIAMVAESFSVLPVAIDGISRAGLWEIVSWGSRMFASGVLMALPVIISLLLINLGMGVVSRAAPQLNIFAVGFPVTLTMGFILMWITVPHVLSGFGEVVDEVFDLAYTVLRLR